MKKLSGLGSTIFTLRAPSEVAIKAVGPTQPPMSRNEEPFIKFLEKSYKSVVPIGLKIDPKPNVAELEIGFIN